MGKFEKFKNRGISWMDDREAGKVADLVGLTLDFEDYGFLNTKNGRAAVAIFRQLPDKFFFLPSVITGTLQDVEEEGMHGDLCDGSQKVSIEKVTAKSGNGYYRLNFL